MALVFMQSSMSNSSISKPNLKDTYDVIIIGAGVVGCAMTRRFALEGAKVLLVEKSGDILDGASKGNSAILHMGFDEETDSIEHQCVTAGYQEFMEIREQLNLPLLKSGAMIVAWTKEQEAKLDGLMNHSIANGVTAVERITPQQILSMEPNLSNTVKGALYFPTEYLIDPWTTPYCYLLQALENGATLSRNTEISSGDFSSGLWELQSNKGPLKSRAIINCAGLYGDRIDQTLINETAFEIRPRKGQFIIYDKAAHNLLKAIILPVPTKTTKGVVVCRTIYGNLLVGPTADEQKSRDDASVDSETLHFLQKKGEEILPGLVNCTVTATYAGIRPATQHQD